MAGTFIDIQVDAKVARDSALVNKLVEVCPVDIFASDGGALRLVEDHLDECVVAGGEVGLCAHFDDRGLVARDRDADATFVTGDFNEPSGLDWTEEAVAEGGYQPIEVDWPTTRAIADRGFVDSYREIHSDPVADPAFTWTPSGEPDDKFDHHDRIDFVLAKGDDLEVIDASIVGESKDAAEIVYEPWPSDHRASVATVQF